MVTGREDRETDRCVDDADRLQRRQRRQQRHDVRSLFSGHRKKRRDTTQSTHWRTSTWSRVTWGEEPEK